MTGVHLTLEVTDHFSSYGDNDDCSIQLKVDDKIFEEKIQSFKPVAISYDSIKKDIKILVKFLKNSQIIANGELNLYQTYFLSKEKNISKWVGLTPVAENLPKKTNSNISSALTSVIRIQIKVTISYGSKCESARISERTSSIGKNSSRTPDQHKEYKQNMQVASKAKTKIDYNYSERNRASNEDTSDLLRVIRGKQPGKNQIKNSNNVNKINLKNPEKKEDTNVVTEENVKEENKIEEVNEKLNDTSQIDVLFMDEKAEELENPVKTLNSFVEKLHSTYSDQYFESLPEDEESLKKEADTMIQELFNLQTNYYISFNDSIALNHKLREHLIKYAAKFRLINKKNNKLKERIESNNLKSNLTTIVNREENDRIKDIININKQELTTYKDIFRINYSEDQLNKFKEEVSNRNEEKDKQSLLRIAENLFKNPKNLAKLSDEKRTLLENILSKYEIKLEHPELNLNNNPSSNEKIPEEQSQNENLNNGDTNEVLNDFHTQPQENNKIEFSDDEHDDQIDNQTVNTDQPKNNVETNLPLTKTNDQVDHKLNTFLSDFYNKRRVSQIPFRRISQGNYEFGTQKVLVKVENEKIKVRVGGGYLLLDKFIEMNAPIEEAKIMNAKNISSKFSKNVNVKKMTGGKPIYSLENNNSNNNNKTSDKIVTSI